MKTTGFGNLDPMTLAQQAIWQTAVGYDNDLRDAAMMLRENAARKEALRALMPYISALETAVKNYHAEGGDTPENEAAMRNALNTLRSELEALGIEHDDPLMQATIAPDANVGEDGLKEMGTGTFAAINEDLAAYIGGLDDALQAAKDREGDIGDKLQLQLQMATNGSQRTHNMISNIEKAKHSAAENAIRNII